MEVKRRGEIWDLGRDNKTLLGGMKRGDQEDSVKWEHSERLAWEKSRVQVKPGSFLDGLPLRV